MIEPALTAEEWAASPNFDNPEDFDRYGGTRHALAALALNGQPFGFTHEEVELLRAAAESEAVGIDDPVERARAGADFNRLADKLEALLPPRETK